MARQSPAFPIPVDVLHAARGGRVLEDRLLAALAQHTAAAREDPRLLRKPVIVVVASIAMRKHLQTHIARRLGPSVLGIVVQLVGHVAADVLRTAGIDVPGGAPMFDVLSRRAAAGQDALRSALLGLEDGFGVAARSVRDLLSAGLDESTGRAALTSVDDAPRSRGLVTAALATRRTMNLSGFGRRSDALAAAASVLEGAGPGGTNLTARALHVFGFADAPGATTRFLAALLRQPNAHLWVDRPGDPCNPAEDDIGTRFLDRFLHRLGFDATVPPPIDVQVPSGKGHEPYTAYSLEGFSKAGAEREAREVAHRVRALIDGGVAPEEIAVVARRLDPYAAGLRKHLSALAIPFSGGALPPRWSPAQRRVDAVLSLLERRDRALVEEWLEARRGRAREADLRLAFRVLGCPVLGAASKIDLDHWLKGEDGLPLPVRRGLSRMGSSDDSASADGDSHEGETDDDARLGRRQRSETARVISARRKVRRADLAATINEAREVVGILDHWPDEASLHDHVTRARDLGKRLRFEPRGRERLSVPDRALARRWRETLDHIAEIAPRFLVTRDEFRLLLGQLLRRAWEPLGGAGSGVQILDVPHARGLTFEHLFLMGLERDVFPRAITEDPLLPDGARRALNPVLPHLATAAASHDEERLLFASLIRAARSTTLSWRHADADGRELAPSAFVERMMRTGVIDRERVKAARPDAREGTARETLLASAVAGGRPLLADLLPAAIDESRARVDVSTAAREALAPPRPEQLTAARLAILDAIDPDRSTREGRRRLHHATPWSGVLGKPRLDGSDPRGDALAVTRLEGIARCPWRDFLGRDLRLERHPDPLAGPPEFTRLLIGNIVHETLEALLRDAGVPADVDLDPDSAVPHEVTRPADDAIATALHEAVVKLARADGHFLPGLHTTLASLCRPYVDRAFDIDFNTGPVPVVALEASATIAVDVDGKPVPVRFKADRVDRTPAGLLLTDYKTGKSISEASGEKTRARHLTKKVAAGTHLQAGAYAHVAKGATGRYLFLKDELAPDNRDFSVTDGDANIELFRATAAALLEARADGIQFPRLGDGSGKVGQSCNWCEHLEACVQNDSGLKMRLEDLADRVRAAPTASAADAFERHLRRLWKLDDGETS